MIFEITFDYDYSSQNSAPAKRAFESLRNDRWLGCKMLYFFSQSIFYIMYTSDITMKGTKSLAPDKAECLNRIFHHLRHDET